MVSGEGTLYAMIVGCEAGFWVALIAGLVFRYVLGWKRASWISLACVPLIDVALLALAVMDLRSGSMATMAHGLALAYVGFTVAFGPVVIAWADGKFARWFGGREAEGGEGPIRGWASVRYELGLWARCLAAIAIIYALLTGVLAVIERPDQRAVLAMWYRIPVGVAFFWFVFGPLWSLVFFEREERGAGPG